MGISVVDFIIDTLKAGGIRAEHACPGSTMMVAQNTVAAVSLEQADQKNNTTTVRIDIIGISRLGAAACEQKAIQVCRILEPTGCICRQESCSFTAATGMFRIPVLATYPGGPEDGGWTEPPELLITLNSEYLDNVMRFTAEQKKVGPNPMPDDGIWEFTLEEFFPIGAAEPPECPQTGFSVSLQRNGVIEVFAGCTMTSRKRITDSTGIRQFRMGTAAYRSVNHQT